MKEKMLYTFYNIPLVDHPRIIKIYKMVKERFAWKGLK